MTSTSEKASLLAESIYANRFAKNAIAGIAKARTFQASGRVTYTGNNAELGKAIFNAGSLAEPVDKYFVGTAQMQIANGGALF